MTTSKKAAKNVAAILSAICEAGNNTAADAIGRDAAFISRLKTGERTITLDEFAELISAIGLEIIATAEQSVTIDRQLYESLGYLARQGLNSIHQDREEK